MPKAFFRALKLRLRPHPWAGVAIPVQPKNGRGKELLLCIIIIIAQMSTWLCEHPGASIAAVRDSAPKDCFQFCIVCIVCVWRYCKEYCRVLRLHCVLAYCNKSTQIIRCFSRQPPHNCFRYLLHDLLDPPPTALHNVKKGLTLVCFSVSTGS